MKFLSLAPVLLVGIAVAATQSGPTFKPKVGQKAAYAVDAKMDVSGMEATIVANIDLEVKKSDDKVVVISSKWSDQKVEVGGNPMGVEAVSGEIELTSSFQPTKVGTGLEGSDMAQWFIISHFIPPVGKELTAGLKYKVEVAEVKDAIPAYTYEGEYVGKEDVAGKPAFKFKGSVKMKSGTLSSELVTHVREDGTVVKTVADFKDMDIPAANAKANGKVTMTAK